MRSIGIRELRQEASRYLRDVERGETIQVTDRGRPLAMLVPIPTGGRLRELAAAGRLGDPHLDLLEVGAPLNPVPGARSASDALAEARDDGR